jgi:hypothetical protein
MGEQQLLIADDMLLCDDSANTRPNKELKRTNDLETGG